MNILAPRRCFTQCLALVLALSGVVPSMFGQRTALAMVPSAAPAGAIDSGALAPSQPMQVVLYLAPDAAHQAALAAYLDDLQTPASASYHAWLTTAQFAQRFGATAAQQASVAAYATSSGLTQGATSASSLRMVFSGNVAQVEAAFSPGLHGVRLGQQMYFANTVAPSVPAALAENLSRLGGLTNMPPAFPMTIALEGGVTAVATDGLAAISDAADANTSRVLSVATSACMEDVDPGSQAAMRLALEQASAEGMTVLAATGCGARGSAGFPSVLAEATSVAPAAGITPPVAATLTELRPDWQLALGLPADGFRHEPDVSVSSLGALTQSVLRILAAQPVPADGSAARLGNINATLYELASEPGLYAQPDSAPASTWEAATGLGLVNLPLLEKFYPRGSLSVNVSISVSNAGYVTHGQSLTFSSTVTDTSGQGNGAVPTGTVTFATSTGIALGSAMAVGGSASVSYNQLPGGSYQVQASYSGDGTYAAGQSITTGFTVAPEAVQLTAVAGSGSVGGTVNITVTAKSTSGVGTPSGTVTVSPQGTPDTTTYSGTLSGSGGTATAIVAVAAVQGGADVFKANCTTNSSFTCYNPQNVTAQVSLGTPTVVVTASPVAPTNGQTDTISVTLSGNGSVYPTPSGNINFYDNGVQLGSKTLSSGSASFTTQALTGSSHSFTATYGGDNNYNTVTAAAGANTSAASATTLALTISPNPPAYGSNSILTAAVSFTLTNSTAPNGTVNFYEDGTLLGSASASGGTAVYTSSVLGSTTTHQFYATYSGDANYQSSTSPTVTTAASGGITTTTVLGISPNPPVSGSTTTLNAVVTPASGTATPSGTVAFYMDGTLLGSSTISGGIASYQSTTFSSTATHSFYAVYSGDTTYKTSTSPTVATSAGTATVSTTTAFTVAPNPPVSGATTILTATIGYIGTIAPTGTVTFYMDSAALATAIVASGVATTSSTTLSSKTAHTFYATYSGDGTYKTSTSTSTTTAASSGTTATTTAVTASATTVATGGTVTLSATVTPSSVVSNTAPTGTVVFTSAQGTLCTAVVSAGAASCSATLTTAGTQSISGTYSGDSNYATSTSAATATVTVGATSSGGVLTASASPSASVMYGASVTLTSTLTPTTAVTGSPAGTVTFMLAGTTALSYTTALVSNGTTAATATYVIPTPVPGTYVITATCASTNVSCTTLSATASLTVIKGNTTTTLVASPTSPLVGQTTTFTATVAPTVTANAGVVAPTGTVTFYVNGVATIVALSNGTATFSTVLTATTGNYVSAIYSGDTNWNGSNSSQLIVNIAPIPTTGTLTANETTALYSANVILKDNILVAATTLTPYPTSPTGTVTFYDLYNGQPTLLGTTSVTPIVLGNSIAQFTTTGLLVGTHLITALFNGGNTYASSTATLTINITDYAVTYSPTMLSVSRGSSGAAIATITPENGFSGQVVLGCTPPGGSEITCSFSPTVVTGGGNSILTVQTTTATASLTRPRFSDGDKAVSLAAVSLGTFLLTLLLPRRRRPALLLTLVAGILAVSSGCATQGTLYTQPAGSSSNSGTPLGTQILTITTQGTDGITTVRHDTSYQVNVQ